MKKQGLKICLNLMINWYNLFYKIVEDSASILFVSRIAYRVSREDKKGKEKKYKKKIADRNTMMSDE